MEYESLYFKNLPCVSLKAFGEDNSRDLHSLFLLTVPPHADFSIRTSRGLPTFLSVFAHDNLSLPAHKSSAKPNRASNYLKKRNILKFQKWNILA
jgi:hypothetical protein